MTKTVFHILPQNNTICGGIKVHAQISSLLREMGYSSFLCFPKVEPDMLSWFKNDVRFLTYQQAEMMACHNDIVIGWEELAPLRSFPVKNKVCYIQHDAYADKKGDYTGIHIWYNTNWVRSKVGKLGSIVTPHLNPIFWDWDYEAKASEKVTVGLQERKAGREHLDQVLQYLSPEQRDRFQFNICPDVSEEKFGEFLRGQDVYFTHSYPEGLGLTGLEAMAAGCIVIGYTGGGGTDYMVNGKNCMYASDGDAQTVAKYLSKITEDWLCGDVGCHMRTEGFKTARSYSRDRMKKELLAALGQIIGKE